MEKGLSRLGMSRQVEGGWMGRLGSQQLDAGQTEPESRMGWEGRR